jgi:hypothetical protein
MSSSEFKFIIIEIPKIINLDLIKNKKQEIKSISAEDALIINNLIELDLSEIEIDDISEDDLFHLGKESLKAKKAVHLFLEDAIDTVLSPRININSRQGGIISEKEFAYLEMEGKLYAVSGDQVSYYGSRVNEAYKYLLALNLSGILNTK